MYSGVQADRMIEACREAGVLLSINLITRYSAVTCKGRDLVDQGVVGKILGLQFHVMVDKPTSYWSGGYSGRVKTDWRPSVEQSGGGVLVMNLVHDIDRFRYMTGLEVVRAYSEYDTFVTDVEVEDYIAVTYRYNNGVTGNATASSCAKGRGGTGNRILGTERQILFDSPRLRVFNTGDFECLVAGEWNDIEVDLEQDDRQVYTEKFAEAVFSGKEPDIPGMGGRKTLEAIVAAYRSGERNQAVDLPL